MSFPDIYLDAINATARRLFGIKKPDHEPVKALVDDLSAKLQEIDTALASIKRQIVDRGDADHDWLRSAKHAQAKYRIQKSSILTLLKTARTTLHFIEAERARTVRLEQSTINTRLTAEAQEERARQAALERLKRIQEANTAETVWGREFKKACKRRLGKDTYLELVHETNAIVGQSSTHTQP